MLRWALGIACGVLFAGGACAESPFDPFELEAGNSTYAYAPGTSISARVYDACTEASGSFEFERDCSDDPVSSVSVTSDEFEFIGYQDDDGPLEVRFTVRALEVANRLCVEVSNTVANDSYDDSECAVVRVRELDAITMEPDCPLDDAVEPYIIPPGSTVEVRAFPRGDGYFLVGADADAAIDPGPFTRTDDLYTAPTTPGPATITETTFGNTAQFVILDPQSSGWSIDLEAIDHGRARLTLDLGGDLPCMIPAIEVTSLTPDTCRSISSVPFEGSTVFIDWDGGVCELEARVAGTDITDTVVFDQWHRMFVTSQEYDGNLGGIAGGDLICNDLATAAELEEQTWMAILSDNASDVRDRIDIRGPIFGVDGDMLYADELMLWNDDIRKDIHITELGEDVSGDVWTGTKSDGTYGPDCEEWSTDSLFEKGTAGNTHGDDGDWIDDGDHLCSADLRLYCLSL